MMTEEVSNKVDYALALLTEVVADCEREGLEDRSVVKAALQLFDFWKDNKVGMTWKSQQSGK
jgi:hypothetical protein